MGCVNGFLRRNWCTLAPLRRRSRDCLDRGGAQRHPGCHRIGVCLPLVTDPETVAAWDAVHDAIAALPGWEAVRPSYHRWDQR